MDVARVVLVLTPMLALEALERHVEERDPVEYDLDGSIGGSGVGEFRLRMTSTESDELTLTVTAPLTRNSPSVTMTFAVYVPGEV